MRMILVASSKGGAGKTTVATNLAAHFAVEGKATAILDADRQKSSTHWCEKRAAMDTAVLPLDGSRRGWDKSLPEGIQRLVVDAPAGAMGDDLTAFLDRADAVVVPVLPSMTVGRVQAWPLRFRSGSRSSASGTWPPCRLWPGMLFC